MMRLTKWRKTKNHPSAAQHGESLTKVAPLQLGSFSNDAVMSIPRTEITQGPLLLPQDGIQTPLQVPRDALQPNTTSNPSQLNTRNTGLFLLNPFALPTSTDIPSTSITYPVDIVAVHGIAGSAYSTWTHKNGSLWLRDFLPAQFPGARIFSYGYAADVLFSDEKGNIGTFASTLLEKLLRERDTVEMRRRPIIFVCHSMGGIVVKKALITAKVESDTYGSILKSVTDILFFATPHRGADYVNILTNMASIANIPTKGIGLSPSVRSDLLKTLRKESKELKEVSTNFRKVLPDLRIVSFVEKKTMLKLNHLLVDENTAVMDDPREIIKHMDGCDHQSICRFADPTDEGYKDVLYRLREAASKATNKILDEMNAEDEPCLDSLAYPDMFHRNLEVDCAAPNTCSWILRHPSYITWMHQSRGVLWVKGKPGSGKSTLMAFIYRAFQVLPAQRTQVNLSFFFHGRGTELQKSAEGMFRSLLQQLYKLSALARRLVLSAFKEKMAFGKAGRGWEWCVKELQDLFSKAVKQVAQWREVTIFVDALDEAGSETAAELVNYFHRLNDSVIAAGPGSCTKICISCRHYPVVARNSSLEILVEEENHRDIWSFVHWRLEDVVHSQSHYPLFMEKRNELGYAVAKKAGDSFQWVGMMMPKVIKMLEDGESFEDIKQMVSEQSSDLFAFYERTLKNVINPRNRVRTLLLMQWVCLAERPLSVTELRFALACDDEVVRPDQMRCEDSKGFVESDGRMKMLVNSLSGGMVETRQYESGSMVQACHQTVNDFLRSGGLQFLLSETGVKSLSLDEVFGRSEDRLCRCCINYLNLAKVLGEEQTWKKEIVHELSFIEYATKFWFVHAEKAEAHGSSQEHLIERFLAKQNLFQTWANIYEVIDRPGARCPDPGSTLIHVASASNLQSIVRALLDHGTSVEEETYWRNRPLHCAARWGHEELTTMLLEANADVEAKDCSGSTPLEQAAANHHEAVVKMLLKSNADINMKTGHSGTALQSACKKGSTSLVRMLIDNGADVNAQAEFFNIKFLLPVDGGNALQAAAYHGNEAVVRLLLDKGAFVDATGGVWGSALQAATSSRHENPERIVRMLLQRGAQVNLRGGRFDTALQGASRHYYNAENLVRILLDSGAEINCTGGEYGSALQAAAYFRKEHIVRMLLNAGADVNMQGGMYGNALQAAAAGGDEEIVKLLLNKGSNIHADGGVYGTALQGAAVGFSQEVIELLLDHGAKLNTEGGKYGSVLQAAATRCSESTIQFLIDRGAQLNTGSGEHGSALQAAVQFGRDKRIVQLLLDNGADVNAECPGDTSITALQAASASGRVDIAKLLLDNGAEANIPGGLYGNALLTAVAFDHEEVAKLLLERGADINVKGGIFGNALNAARGGKGITRLLLDWGAKPISKEEASSGSHQDVGETLT